jgi:cytochrome c-type biogenesis protein CcmH
MDQDISALKNQLLQLVQLRDGGTLTPEQYQESKAQIERKILDRVLSADDAQQVLPAAVVSTSAPDAPAPSAPAQRRPPFRLMAGLAAVIVVVATIGYILTRTAEPVTNAGDEAGAPDAAAAVTAPHATNSEQMGAMMDKLAARLKDNPGDAAGWAMLARSYGVLGRSTEAVEAYAKALDLSKTDSGLMVDYADALAVKNNRVLAGEPMKLINRALKIDPRNVKALAMAGTDAFDRKDYRGAVKLWERVVEFGGADNLFVQQIQGALAEARKLAGLPASARPASSSAAAVAVPGGVAPADAAPTSAPNGSIQGTVTLAAALSREAKPEDTVFIFARAAEGSRMPLAILRKQVKDLPIAFNLDDSMSMSPAANLSKAGRVTVGARISKSGNAIPEKGDLAGQSAPVTVGAKGLKIEIKDIVKQ